MKKFAVGYMDYFYNDLSVEIITAYTWREALMKHSGMNDMHEWLLELGDVTLETVKQECFNLDFLIDVTEIDVLMMLN